MSTAHKHGLSLALTLLTALGLAWAPAGCGDADRRDTLTGSDTGDGVDSFGFGICGDSRIDNGEDCDDGNDVDGDACRNDCRFNTTGLCGLCAGDQDCSLGGLCLQVADAMVCGLDCSESDVCPDDYSCVDVLDDDDVVGRQCLPDADDCGVGVSGLCGDDNGGCDPLTTCTVEDDDTVTCGDCPSGYTGDGVDGCVDVDECDPENPCAAGSCTNLPGGYECSCNEGFAFDGTTCVDVDECDENPTICGDGTCTNEQGSYSCDCRWPAVASRGTCVHCPPEDALTIELNTASCMAYPGESIDELVALTETNLRGVLDAGVDSLQFLNESTLLTRLFECDSEDEECGDPVPIADLHDFVDGIVDAFADDLLTVDHIATSDACRLTLAPPASELCRVTIPDSCDPDNDECPTNMVCSPDAGTCVAQSCDTPEQCGDGWTCADFACVRASCGTDADCGGSDSYCDGGTCASYCLFADTPLSATLWHAGDGDVYAEVAFGAGDNAVNFLDVRAFDDQLALIVDAAAAVEAFDLLISSSRYADEEESFPLPSDMGGQLELALTELAPGDYDLSISVRNLDLGSDFDGLHGSWVLEEAFDSFPNEIPLPVLLDLGPTCPLAYVHADNDSGALELGVHMSPSSLVLPFGFLANNPFFGGGDEDEECVDEQGASIECPCYDVDGFAVACPCYDDDGMPTDCDSGAIVPCPYEENGDPAACLPNVGSVRADIAGPRVLLSLRLDEGDGEDSLTASIGLGDGPTALLRDFADDAYLPFVTAELNRDDGNRPVQPGLQVATAQPGVRVRLQDELNVDVSFDLGNLADRLTTAPVFLVEDHMAISLLGIGSDGPDLRLNVMPEPVRPVELVQGVLTLYSSYLESNELPPRTPPGTVTVEAGQCLVDSLMTDDDTHIFEALAPGSCPNAAPLAADATVDTFQPTTTLGNESTLVVRDGGNPANIFLGVDAAALPDEFSEVRLQLFHENSDVHLQGDFHVHLVEEAWLDESITWDNQPTIAESPAVTRTREQAENDAGTWWSFDITDLASAWKASPGTNFGLVLVSTGQTDDEVRFTSQEVTEDLIRRPRLLVFP